MKAEMELQKTKRKETEKREDRRGVRDTQRQRTTDPQTRETDIERGEKKRKKKHIELLANRKY